jgi:hypothetical protein
MGLSIISVAIAIDIIIAPKVSMPITSIDSCHYAVVGFSPNELTADERGEGYPVLAGFLSGRPVIGGPINLSLAFGTAGKVFPFTPYIDCILHRSI